MEKIKDPAKHKEVRKEIETYLDSLFHFPPQEAFLKLRKGIRNDLGEKDIEILKNFLIRLNNASKFVRYVFDTALNY